jgi:hypothetical protein
MNGGLRCDVTELYRSDCAHCRNITDQPDPAGPRSVGPWVVAYWPGTCAGCGNDFDQGDMIRRDEVGGWVSRCCGEPVP